MSQQAMKKLNQVLAVSKSVQAKRESDFTKIYQDVQKPGLTEGFTKNYTPLKEDGDRFPPESKKVQLNVETALGQAATALKEIVNIIALKDNTNMSAKADVVLDGEVVLKGVPAVHLLFLEKRVASIIDFINHLPVLSQDASWSKNEGAGLWETQPTDSFRTKKVESYVVVVPPTKEFAAQTAKQVIDENVGTWRNVNFSGALNAERKNSLLARAEKVQQAVKIAREEANQQSVVELSTGKLVDFIFGP